MLENKVTNSGSTRAFDSKREMDILDNLEEVKQLNKRHVKIDTENIIEANRKKHLSGLQEDVLEKDAKESYNKLVRHRADLFEQDQQQERMEKENNYQSDSSEDLEGLMDVMNIKKRDMKTDLKGIPIGFGKLGVKISKKQPQHDAKEQPKHHLKAFNNPLDMLGSDSDSEED